MINNNDNKLAIIIINLNIMKQNQTLICKIFKKVNNSDIWLLKRLF